MMWLDSPTHIATDDDEETQQLATMMYPPDLVEWPKSKLVAAMSVCLACCAGVVRIIRDIQHAGYAPHLGLILMGLIVLLGVNGLLLVPYYYYGAKQYSTALAFVQAQRQGRIVTVDPEILRAAYDGIKQSGGDVRKLQRYLQASWRTVVRLQSDVLPITTQGRSQRLADEAKRQFAEGIDTIVRAADGDITEAIRRDAAKLGLDTEDSSQLA